MTGTVLAIASLALVLPSTLCFLRNLGRYRPPPEPAPGETTPSVSVLIPARDEEANIEGAILSVLQAPGTTIEVVVLDDHSSDRTRELVLELARQHPEVRVLDAPPLPPGWCGKQHACQRLAEEARYDVLVFMDADVRLEPGACARIAAFLETSKVALASGVPRQILKTWLEKLLLPLIHFTLLAFLPIGRMRQSRHPAYGAGCGQLMAVRKEPYHTAGGHAAIRSTLHDGLKLPRALRMAGFFTDLFDATSVASCRMYHGATEVWRGLSKNATEGLAHPKVIVPATIVLLGGQALPVLLLALGPWLLEPTATLLAGIATAAVFLPRLLAVRRFSQPVSSAILHPLAVVLFLMIQWTALARSLRGRASTWKGRAYKQVDSPQSTVDGRQSTDREKKG